MHLILNPIFYLFNFLGIVHPEKQDPGAERDLLVEKLAQAQIPLA
jgi:hypothetical protein